jgi:class 3 adenylate cyclase
MRKSKIPHAPPRPAAPATKTAPEKPQAHAPAQAHGHAQGQAQGHGQAFKPKTTLKSPDAPHAGAAGDGMKRETLAIAFVDLARFQIASRRVRDEELVSVLEEYYQRVVDHVTRAGGRVVKFMGDGALVVFPVNRASDAARALVDLKKDVDVSLSARHFLTAFVGRLHVGEVMSGSFGAKSDKRYDVIGQAVNRTATIRMGETVALTADAYAKLDAGAKKLFTAKGDHFVAA